MFSFPIFLPTIPQGQVDLDGEINKCEKKLALAKMNLSKIEKIEAQGDYETTVPANVRSANEDKARRLPLLFYVHVLTYFDVQRKTLEADIKLLEHSIDMYTKMK